LRLSSIFEGNEQDDDRNFKEQMNDLGVEVLPMSKSGLKTAVIPEPKKEDQESDDLKKYLKYYPPDMTDDEIETALIKDGIKSRIGVKTIREIPPLKLLKLCINKQPIIKIAIHFGKSKSVISNLKKFYEINRDNLVRKGLIEESPTRKPKAIKNSEVSNKNSEVSNKNSEVSNKKEVLTNKKEPLINKTITAPGNIVAGEVLGTAKMLDRLGNEEVTVEVKVWKLKKEGETIESKDNSAAGRRNDGI